jgi:hypothetical protein
VPSGLISDSLGAWANVSPSPTSTVGICPLRPAKRTLAVFPAFVTCKV